MIATLHRWQCDAPGCKAVAEVPAKDRPEGWIVTDDPRAVMHDSPQIHVCSVHAPPLRAYMAEVEAYRELERAEYDRHYEEVTDAMDRWRLTRRHPSFLVEPFPAPTSPQERPEPEGVSAHGSGRQGATAGLSLPGRGTE